MLNFKDRVYAQYLSNRGGAGAPDSIDKSGGRSPFYKYIIKKFFPENFGANIIDLGCGFGALVYYARLQGYSKVIGVDSSSEMVKVGCDLGIDDLVANDGLRYLKSLESESIDLITAIDVLEHLTKPCLFSLADELYRVLRPGGVLVTHQPNGEGIFSGAILYGDITHENAFTRVSIAQVFLAAGFSEVKSFEDKPIVHGVKSAVRRVLGDFVLRPVYKFLVAVECGGSDKGIIFTKNFLTVVKK